MYLPPMTMMTMMMMIPPVQKKMTKFSVFFLDDLDLGPVPGCLLLLPHRWPRLALAPLSHEKVRYCCCYCVMGHGSVTVDIRKYRIHIIQEYKHIG